MKDYIEYNGEKLKFMEKYTGCFGKKINIKKMEVVKRFDKREFPINVLYIFFGRLTSLNINSYTNLIKFLLMDLEILGFGYCWYDKKLKNNS